jgi:hypothetical protein
MGSALDGLPGTGVFDIGLFGDDYLGATAQSQYMEEKPAPQKKPMHGREKTVWPMVLAVGASVCRAGGKHGSGRRLAADLRCASEMRKKPLNRVNARIQGFPSLDLGDGVEGDACRLRHFLDLRKGASVQVLKKSVKYRCHAEYLTVSGRPTQALSYRSR